jgi:hypothetical protein
MPSSSLLILVIGMELIMSFHEHLQAFGRKLNSPKFKLGAATMGIPMSYIAFRHVQWKRKPDAQKRMLIHHLVFWPLCIVGIKGMHMSFGLSGIRRALGLMAASGTLIAGFEGGGRLAKKLVPKQFFPEKPASPNSLEASHIAFQVGFRAGLQAASSNRLAPQTLWMPYASPSVYRLF